MVLEKKETFPKSFCEITAEIKKASNIAIISHYNPDCDAIGSSMALYQGVLQLGKKAIIVNETEISDRFDFMPGVLDIKRSLGSFKYDFIITCDCGDRKRIGEKLSQEIPPDASILNIDHHKSNSNFGKINWVEGAASSTSEMIFSVLESLGVVLTKEISTNLLTGIITDTGSFRYASTSPSTLKVAARLIESGANIAEISKNVFERKSKQSVMLGARVIAGIEFLLDGKIAVATVTQKLLHETGTTLDDTEGLVEEGRAIRGVVVSVLLKEDIDQWYASLRSSKDGVDVSQVAATFGGGGHTAAAAFRWKKVVGDRKPELINELKKLLS